MLHSCLCPYWVCHCVCWRHWCEVTWAFCFFFFSLTGAAALSCMVPPNLYSYSDGGVAALFTKDVFVCCEQIFSRVLKLAKGMLSFVFFSPSLSFGTRFDPHIPWSVYKKSHPGVLSELMISHSLPPLPLAVQQVSTCRKTEAFYLCETLL